MEKKLTAQLVAAEDAEHRNRIVMAWLDWEAYWTFDGCERPERAMLAVLVMFPDQLAAVRAILPRASALETRPQRDLYAAMLAAPAPANFIVWWEELAAYNDYVGELIRYELSNVTHVTEYAKMIVLKAAQRFLLDQCAKLARAGYGSDPLLQTVQTVGVGLAKLQSRLREVL